MLAPWLAWAVVRTFGLERGPVVPLITFTPYMGLLAPLPLVVALALRRWAVAAAAAVVIAAFAAALLPRAFGDGGRPVNSGGPTVRIMASNLFVGAGDPEAVVALAARERVDVLALEELTPAELGRLRRAGLTRLLPYAVYDPAGGGGSGSGLFSRRPLRRRAPVNPRPQQGEPRALLAVPGARAPLDVQVIHPLPPTTAAWRGVWEAMLDALPRPGVRRGAAPLAVLAGDFNATLDHARLRRLLGGDGGYVDAADLVGAGYATTWPAGRHVPPEIAIDHVLVDPRVRVDAFSVHLVPGSDHRAVVATVRLPPASG